MNQEIIIEKGIPISTDSRGRPGSKYPFAKMEVGDSFQVEFVAKERTHPPASASAYLYGKRTKTKWTSRVTKVDGKHFVRVWRIK